MTLLQPGARMARRRGIEVVVMSQASAPRQSCTWSTTTSVAWTYRSESSIERTYRLSSSRVYGDVPMTVQPMKAGAVEFLTNLDLGRPQRINLSFPRV
jgi:hypothetical protein